MKKIVTVSFRAISHKGVTKFELGLGLILGSKGQRSRSQTAWLQSTASPHFIDIH